MKETTISKLRRLREILSYATPPRPIRFILWVTLAGMVIFSLTRVTLLLRNLDMLETGIDNTYDWVLYALLWGIRFDISFITKLLLLPLALLGISAFVGRFKRWITTVATAITIIAMSVAIFLDIADMPFFEYCHSHLNAQMALSYLSTDAGQTTNLIIGNTSYIVYAIVDIVAVIGFGIFVFRLARYYRLFDSDSEFESDMKSHRIKVVIYVVIMGTLLTFTTRGLSFRWRPLQMSDTVISNNNFINQLCVNPVEPLLGALIAGTEHSINLMDSDEAYSFVCEALHRDESFTHHFEAKESPWSNVVIIVQEGNTASRLAHEGDTKGLLPNLDRLITEGRYYENAYSSSTHTSYGIYGIVTSLPPYLDLHPLKDGLQHNLGTAYDQVYHRGDMTTLFFVPHRPDFDNVNGFIPMQGFERFVSLPDYGVETDKMWGVDDHIMFDYALEQIDKEHAEGKRVAAVLLTCSNHSPFDAPDVEGFTPKSTDAEEEAIEYADWAMNRFLEMAKEREWFDDTLFVITADHGRYVSEDYIMNESIFHIPLLFYSPKHIAPEVRSDLVAQADITPTAMSMLGVEFDNHTVGIDLTSESREYVVYTSVEHLACRSHKWLYAHNPTSEIDYLYDLEAEGNDRLKNVAAEHPDVVEEMYRYAAATIQAGWDIHNKPENSYYRK